MIVTQFDLKPGSPGLISNCLDDLWVLCTVWLTLFPSQVRTEWEKVCSIYWAFATKIKTYLYYNIENDMLSAY